MKKQLCLQDVEMKMVCINSDLFFFLKYEYGRDVSKLSVFCKVLLFNLEKSNMALPTITITGADP